jgi:hypothetical protein
VSPSRVLFFNRTVMARHVDILPSSSLTSINCSNTEPVSVLSAIKIIDVRGTGYLQIE